MKSELRKQQYTVTLFDCNHLAHVIVSWQIQKFICYCTVIVSQYFAFEGNFQIQTPGGLYSDARFNRRFFCAPSLGSYIWGGLMLGILRYIQWIVLSNILTTGARWLPFVLEQ